MVVSHVIRVGVLGLGRSGWGIHAAAIADHPGFDVTAVADPQPDRRDEAIRRFGCEAYAEPGDLLSQSGIDLAVVATPSHTHVPLALKALDAGLHVVVEKPMAQDALDVDAMIEAAERGGRLLTCYLPRRLDPDFLAIQALIREGRLGELTLVRRTVHNFFRRRDWQMLRRFDGGALSNTVPHLLDQVLQFAGPGLGLELLADLRHTVGAGDAEDHVVLVLRAKKGGPLLQVEASSAIALPQPQWTVMGTNGAIVGDSTELSVRWSDPSQWSPLTVSDEPVPGRKYGTDEILVWNDESIVIDAGVPPVRQFYDNLLAVMTSECELVVRPETVRPQIALLQLARAQTGYR